ncbi:MAG: hypothetical protein R2844_22310 [Caldilineales bacterium]
MTAIFDEAARADARAASSIFQSGRFFLDLGGVVGRMRCTGGHALKQRLVAPLAHMLTEPAQQAVDFTVDWVDASDCDMPWPAMPWAPQRSSVEQGTSEYLEPPFLFTEHGDSVVTGLDASRARTVAVVRSAVDWPPDHYHQSIFITLYQQVRRHGLHLIHAAAVGLRGRVVLLTGASGSGKTTTMLSCIRHGFEFYSDDATLLRRTAGGIAVVSLLGTINATPQTLAWFPELAPVAAPVANRTGKRLAMINAAFPGQAARQGQVAAIMVPEITGLRGTSLTPMSRGEVLSAVLPFSLDLHDPAGAREQLDFLVDAVETIPCYRLRLGNDLSEVPRFIASFLST